MHHDHHRFADTRSDQSWNIARVVGGSDQRPDGHAVRLANVFDYLDPAGPVVRVAGTCTHVTCPGVLIAGHPI